jgi:hypothetical protein
MVTPYPSPKAQDELQRDLEAWLPGQGLNKPRLLMEYDTVKHNDNSEVSKAAMKRALPGGSSWRVPLTQHTSVTSGSGLHLALSKNPNLTQSPWGSEPPASTNQGANQTINAAAEGSQAPCHGVLVPVPTTSCPQLSGSEESAPVSVVLNRVDSAPYHNHHPCGDSFDGDSTLAWGAEKERS